MKEQMKCEQIIIVKVPTPPHGELKEYQKLCGGEMEEKGVVKMEDFTDVAIYQCAKCKDIKIV